MALLKEFYTAGELAKILAVSRKTISRMVRGDLLPSHQIGRSRRFRRDDVEAFLARCRVQACAEATSGAVGAPRPGPASGPPGSRPRQERPSTP